MSRRRPKTVLHSVAVMAFDRINAFHLSVPCLVFGEDRSELGEPAFEPCVCATEIGELCTTGGLSIDARHGLGQLAHAALMIVPRGRDPNERPPEQRALAARHFAQAVSSLNAGAPPPAAEV